MRARWLFAVVLAACGGTTASRAGGTPDAAPDDAATADGPLIDGLTFPDAFAPDTCGFDVGSGSESTKASVVGGTASASLGGTEIPFILWSCSGTAGGVPYTVTGNYNVQVGILSLGLTTGSSTFSFVTPGGCTGTARFDGQTYPDGGDPYRLGEKFELAFQCSMLTNEAGATASIASGALSAILSP